jgi:hypothetical protein
MRGLPRVLVLGALAVAAVFATAEASHLNVKRDRGVRAVSARREGSQIWIRLRAENHGQGELTMAVPLLCRYSYARTRVLTVDRSTTTDGRLAVTQEASSEMSSVACGTTSAGDRYYHSGVWVSLAAGQHVEWEELLPPPDTPFTATDQLHLIFDVTLDRFGGRGRAAIKEPLSFSLDVPAAEAQSSNGK